MVGRWVGCALMLSFACTRSNPWFHTLPADGSTGESSSTGAHPGTTAVEPPGSSSGDASTGAGGSSATTTGAVDASSSGEPADPSTTGEAPGSTTDGETTSTGSTGSTGETTGTSDTGDTTTGGPCEDVCGTPGCGTCPDAAVVQFPGFAIDAVEVTNDQYALFLEAAVTPAIQASTCAWNQDFTPVVWPLPAAAGGLPVVNVDWCDAVAFCAWAGKRLCGQIGGGPAALADIISPTKNQWYRACSGGVGNTFPYGDVYAPDACNGVEDGNDGLAPTGSIATCEGSLTGLFDMSGNVFEWVDTCGEGDELAPCLRRGGSFYSQPTAMQCNLKSERPRNNYDDYVGLRCCTDG